jgi:predicted nucleic acid-binding protein
LTRFVVDSSVAVPWVVPEIFSPQATLLLEPNHQRLAPPWIALENGNALWKRVKKGEITPEQARQIFAAMPAYLTYVDASLLTAPALDIAMAIGETTYDSLYVALAESLGEPFVTADRRLYDAVRRHLSTDIIWIEDLPAVLA